MTAPELSPEEQDIVARFDAAPTLPEAYQPSPPVALLDQLDELRAKATPGPWVQNEADPAYVIGQVSEDGEEYLDVADTGARCLFTAGGPGWEEAEADAALIVAAVNAVGPLTAAVRAVLELVGELDAEESDPDVPTSAERRAGWHAALAAVRTALSVTP